MTRRNRPASASFTPKAIRYIIQRDSNICFYCKQLVTNNDGQAAHVVSYIKGGPAIPSNGVWSHKACNIKASKWLDSRFVNEAYDYLLSKGEDMSWYHKTTIIINEGDKIVGR